MEQTKILEEETTKIKDLQLKFRQYLNKINKNAEKFFEEEKKEIIAVQ
jgi:hypothetical protein